MSIVTISDQAHSDGAQGPGCRIDEINVIHNIARKQAHAHIFDGVN